MVFRQEACPVPGGLLLYMAAAWAAAFGRGGGTHGP